MHARARVSFIVSLHEHATNILLPRLPPLPSRVHDSFTARASPAVALNCAAGSLEGFPFLDVKTRLFRAHRAGYRRESSDSRRESRSRRHRRRRRRRRVPLRRLYRRVVSFASTLAQPPVAMSLSDRSFYVLKPTFCLHIQMCIMINLSISTNVFWVSVRLSIVSLNIVVII